MEAICFSETSVETQRTTRRHIPEDDTLHNHRCENLKSYNFTFTVYNYDSLTDTIYILTTAMKTLARYANI
jgi:hypothetical protein